MNTLLLIIASVYLMAGCAKAPVKPSDKPALSGIDAKDGATVENHDEHDHGSETASGTTPGTDAIASSHAADLELLNNWTKGQYAGNGQLQLSYLATVPLP